MGCCSTGLKRTRPAALTNAIPSASDLEGGCTIEEAHMRGVTLHQLDKLIQYTKRCCQEQPWTHDRASVGSTMRRVSSSDLNQLIVKESDINLYMVVDRVVKPLTQRRGYSYVEFASLKPEEQVPQWFVSHYWGAPVEDFMACISFFHKRHALKNTTPFWICAYALRQHHLDTEIVGEDPWKEAFAKAITSDNVQGTVTILDEKLETYKRAWCCFEATVTFLVEKRLDLVVSQKTNSGKRNAFMIADGPAGADGENAEAQYSSFPQKVAEEGMRITIEISTASKSIDRNRILNCIAKERVSSEVPPLHHDEYDQINDLLRIRFAAIVLRVAIANGDSDGVRRALHCGVARDAQSSQLQVAKNLLSKHPHEQAQQEIVAYLERACACSSTLQRSMPDGGELNLNRPVPEEVDEDSDSDIHWTTMPSETQSVKSTRPRSSVSSSASTSNMCITQPRISISSAYSNTSLKRFVEQYNASKHTPPRSRPQSELGDRAPGDCFSILPAPGLSSSAATSRRSSRCHSDPHLRSKKSSIAEPLAGSKKKAHAQSSTSLGAMTNGTIIEGAHGSRQPKSGAKSGAHQEKAHDGLKADADFVEQMIDELRAAVPDSDRLEQSLRALGTFAAVNPSCQKKACEAGALHIVLSSMRAALKHLGVQREACQALSTLIFNSKQHALEAMREDAGSIIKTALQMYPRDSRLLQEGRRALGEMALVDAHDLTPPPLERKRSEETASSMRSSMSSSASEVPSVSEDGEYSVAPFMSAEKAAQKTVPPMEDFVGNGILLEKGLPPPEAMLARKRFRATSMDYEAQAGLTPQDLQQEEQQPQDMQDSMLKLPKHLQSLSGSKEGASDSASSAPTSSRSSQLKILGQELGVPAAPQAGAMRQEKKASTSEEVVTGALEKLRFMESNGESS